MPRETQRESLPIRQRTEKSEKNHPKLVVRTDRIDKWKPSKIQRIRPRKSGVASPREDLFYSGTKLREIRSRVNLRTFATEAGCRTNRRPFIAPTKLAPAASLSDAQARSP